jgi:magnesium transporter
MVETIKIGTLQWHHILHPSEEDFLFLEDNFHFHPLDIEDCKSRSQRSKIDTYDDYYFLILHFPSFDKINRFIKTKEVKIFWGEDYIITIGKSHWVIKTLFNEIKEKYGENPEDEDIPGTSDLLLYHVLERLMIETQRLLQLVDNSLVQINAGLFDIKAEKTIERISVTRKNLILLNTILKPQLRLFHKFESGDIKGFLENMEDYWGNILDYYQKMWDMVEDYEELIEGFSKTFDSLQANRTSEIMKLLTIISTTLLPLTFLTGLYGMNLGLPYEDNPNFFWILVGVMLVVVIVLLLFFRRKKLL